LPEHVIGIRGAREHNLENIDLDLPRNQLIVLTGVSGSGKSSLAFDTLFREGQRRFLETFSARARLLMGKLDRPDCDAIEGLSPTVALAQQQPQPNPRSTVGTLTGLYDCLRLLFSESGTQYCGKCGAESEATNSVALARRLIDRFADRPVRVLAPLVEDHSGARRALFRDLSRHAVSHVWIDGEVAPLDPLPTLDPGKRHTIRAVLGIREGLSPSRIKAALALGRGTLFIEHDRDIERFSIEASCGGCGSGLPALGMRLFSFNGPHGVCPRCRGLGVVDVVDPDLLVADPGKTLREGALVPSTPGGYIVYSQVTIDVLDQICRAHGFGVDTPWRDLSEAEKKVIFFGSRRLKVPFGKHPLENRLKWKGITAKPREEGYYQGLVPVIEETLKRNRNKNILRFARSETCPDCSGSRLRPEARSVRLLGYGIDALARKPCSEVVCPLSELRGNPMADPILELMDQRIEMIEALGLGHLALSRGADSLASGEAHRLRLATLIDQDLAGLLYVLDEPSAGLHPRDRQRLDGVLRLLVDRGNTVLVVEHDERGMVAADHLIELGPGAGREGGRVIFSGSPSDLSEGSSFPFLDESHTIPVPDQRRLGNGKTLRVSGASANNLRDLDACFVLGAFNAVSGVSGAGKTTLVDKTLASAIRRARHGASTRPGTYRSIEGIDAIDKIIHIDQTPIGRTPRSNPATYTKLMDKLRAIYAGTPAAKAAGLGKTHFSTNTAPGCCETCAGAGRVVIGMHMQADIEVRCTACNGHRFVPEVLQVTLNGRAIDAVLDLTIKEADRVLRDEPAIARITRTMLELGLGHLTLGQSATTLSGGEAQRVKLAAELARPTRGHVLYVLDEPTGGLHPADTALLIEALECLVSAGHTVIVVEHNLHVLKRADHLIDLGPESGERGGRIVAQGTPEQVAACPRSHTGRALAEMLEGGSVPIPQPRPKPNRPHEILMKGVDTHNLRDVTVRIPHNRLVAITGRSGSGKSSLAFQTLFAEGRKRFAATLSNQARRSLEGSGSASFAQIEGLSPTIALGQRQDQGNKRATVGTRAGVLDHLRLLFARIGKGAEDTTAAHFSFNHLGACRTCSGSGTHPVCDPDRLVTHPERSLFNGAMDGTSTGRFYGDRNGQYLAILSAVAQAMAIDLRRPWSDLGPEERAVVMSGCGTREFSVSWHYKRGNRTGRHDWKTAWHGLTSLVEEEYARKCANGKETTMADVMREVACPECDGSRLAAPYRDVCVAGQELANLSAMQIADLRDWCLELPDKLTESVERAVAAKLGTEIASSLGDLIALGLPYLTLDRRLESLSGGELMRLRLAGQLATRLSGVTIVLDEPTAGLHPRDTERLVTRMRALVDQGNSVVVVEHDLDVIRAADHIIELGPGSGPSGGRIVATGSPTELEGRASPTGRWLSGRSTFATKSASSPTNETITIRGARANNLQNLDLDIPAFGLTAVTGVSGSGKTSLVFDVIAASFEGGRPMGCDRFVQKRFHHSERVDQVPPSRGGFLATRIGIWDPIRTLFAQTAANATKRDFALGGNGGRCETCAGKGRVVVGMDFLDSIQTQCPDCSGNRFQERVLAFRLNGASIADVAEMTASEAADFFADHDRIAGKLKQLVRIGLGYLELGRIESSLSGGESRRLRLADALLDARMKATLFFLDEPTTGLHNEDIRGLLTLFDELVDAGHGLIVVEHHPGIIAHADHVIDLGPESGEHGGRLLFSGRPDQLEGAAGSITARYTR